MIGHASRYARPAVLKRSFPRHHRQRRTCLPDHGRMRPQGAPAPRPRSPQRLADDLRPATKSPETKPKDRQARATHPLLRYGRARARCRAKRQTGAAESRGRAGPRASGARSPGARRAASRSAAAPSRTRAMPRVGYADLRVGAIIRPAAALMAIILARGPGPGNDLGADRTPLGLVAVEQALRRGTLHDKRQLRPRL